jgi:hypothetical protein
MLQFVFDNEHIGWVARRVAFNHQLYLSSPQARHHFEAFYRQQLPLVRWFSDREELLSLCSSILPFTQCPSLIGFNFAVKDGRAAPYLSSTLSVGTFGLDRTCPAAIVQMYSKGLGRCRSSIVTH